MSLPQDVHISVRVRVSLSQSFAAETNPILSAIALPSPLLSFIYPHLLLLLTTLAVSAFPSLPFPSLTFPLREKARPQPPSALIGIRIFRHSACAGLCGFFNNLVAAI